MSIVAMGEEVGVKRWNPPLPVAVAMLVLVALLAVPLFYVAYVVCAHLFLWLDTIWQGVYPWNALPAPWNVPHPDAPLLP